MDFTSSSNETKKVPRNYRCIYDPELDFEGSKKSKQPLFEYEDESVSVLPVRDPRINNEVYQKNFEKGKFLYNKQVKLVEHKFDEHSVGPRPLSNVLASRLSSLMTETQITTFFSIYGRESLMFILMMMILKTDIAALVLLLRKETEEKLDQQTRQ
ncbi:hypothetical protein G6F56_006431 [Rhizopus delemar]|nr:hypothetical protein G6F56_006431 [Rhizopus delemar]